MHSGHDLQKEIYRLQQHLHATAKHYKFDMGHPRVLKVSQQLDRLILQFMSRNNR